MTRAFVTSDLHLGSGPDNPLEDFDQDAIFAAWVKEIASPGTLLVLNGDFVDFAQIPPYEVPKDDRLLWTEAASLQKLEAAIAGHGACFEALAGLLEAGGELELIGGNHDLDLAWPGVRARLREAMGPVGQSDRLRFVTNESRYHGVLIAHGHQFTPENCPVDPERFFHEQGEERYLERVWGTDFMLSAYNALELQHPYADNVKPLPWVVFQALTKGWLAARDLLRFVLFLKRRGIPWGGLASATLDVEEPAAAEDVVESFSEVSWKIAVEGRLEDPAFVEQLERELAALPPEDAALLRSPETFDPGVEVAEGAGATLGIFREDREIRAARAHLAEDGITAVIFGHTHEIVDGHRDRPEQEPFLFNPGTWIPHLDLRDPQVKAKIDAQGLTKDLLSDKSLYRVDRRAVLIEPDAAGYRAALRLVEIP